MIRAIRRSLRGWKREFLLYWAKLTTFYRIVLGILLAMGLVALGRTRYLDPRGRELADLRKTLEQKGVPVQVHTPDSDPDLAEDRIRLENLLGSVENRRNELRAVEDSTPFRLEARPADAAARLLALLNQNGLRVHANRPLESPADTPLPALLTAYDIRGGYEGVIAFLRDFTREPLLWDLQDFQLRAPTEAEPGGLRLTFTLRFTPYPGR